jgi:hypothetical protein
MTERMASLRFVSDDGIIHGVLRIKEDNETYWVYGTMCVFTFIESSWAVRSTGPITCLGCLARL